MFLLDPEEFLIKQEEYAREFSDPEAEWAAWQKVQSDYQSSLRAKPVYVVSITTKGIVRYCGGAEFKSIEEAITYAQNNSTSRGYQGISCLLPKI